MKMKQKTMSIGAFGAMALFGTLVVGCVAPDPAKSGQENHLDHLCQMYSNLYAGTTSGEIDPATAEEIGRILTAGFPVVDR